MGIHRLHIFLLPLLILLLAFSMSAQGQTFETMFAVSKGADPSGGLVKGSDGNLYGTTYTGGIFDQGTVFKITPAGELTTLVMFRSTSGSYPRGGLVEGDDGAFYGTTSLGGANGVGTVFKVTPAGELTTLVSFNRTNGYSPQTRLVQGSDGAFYGTTYYGGGSNLGTVFKVTPAGELTALLSFNGSNGSNPNAELIKGSDGAFYGTTSAGGANSKGTVFKVTAAGVLTTLISFDGSNGSGPSGVLLEGSDGVFYGTTFGGGTSSLGTVFKVTAAGELTTLISFDATNGSNPSAGLVKGSDGVFYGVTRQGGANGYGTVFKLTEAGGLTTLLSFEASKGVYPSDELLEGNEGVFYGITAGDPASNAGTVFKITTDGELTALVNFNNTAGAFPYARLLEANGGVFYGTTSEGGMYNKGTIFEVTRNGERTTLADFNGTNGATPYAGLVEGSDGAFYGTTRSGGASDRGTVFKVTAAGVLTRLASFNSTHGGGPRAALVKGSDGAFYGTTYGIFSLGGSRHHGTVFKVTPSGTLTTLVFFDGTNGTDPSGELVEGSDGAFYGTTTSGGSGGRGTVFKVTRSGVLTTLVSFDGTNGAGPSAGLLKGSDGAFYGTTGGGGAFNAGTVFKVTSAGAQTTLFSFNRNTGNPYGPYAGVTEGADGAFYGVTTAGGAHGHGAVFKLTPSRVLTTLHSFDGTKAANPRGTPIFSSDGDLYGTANQMAIWRVVFSSAPAVTTDAADAVSATGATLHGSVIPNGGSTKVWFEYGTTTAYGSTTAVQDIGAGSTSLAVSQSLMLLPHTTYHFRVVAQNAKGTTYGEDQSFTTLNSMPIATADVVDGAYGRAVPVPVLTNDTDADGDTLTVMSFTQPSHGRVIRAGTDSNVLVYIPQLGFSGVDSFTYTVSDGRSAALTGNVEITVGARPAPSSSVALDTEAPVPGAGEQGSGIPSGATWRIFGVPAINDAGQVAVLGTWKSPEGSGSGIFVDEQLVVKTGDPVPGLASFTFKSFTDPVLNEAGRVAFRATITGPGVRKNNDTVLATNAFAGELELVAREGDVAAETGEARYGKFYNVSLQGNSDNAGLLFTASLLKGSGSPKVKPTNDLGAWLRTSSSGVAPRKVVQEGDPGFAAGEKIKSFQLLQALRGSPAQGRGHYKADEVSFTVTLTSKRQAVVRFSEGALEAEEFTGELVGEALPEAKWKSFGLSATDGTGMVSAVRATLQSGLGGVKKANATGIFLRVGTGGAYAPVVRVGDEAFGVEGALFSALSDPLVSGWNPGVAFLGSIRGQGVRGNNNTGIWWQTLSGSTLVARAGMQAIEAPEGALWKSFSSLALPDSERGPLFVGTLAKGAGAVNAINDTGLWAMDSVGEVRLLVRERDLVGEKTLKSFSTLQAVSGSSGVRRSFNNAGQVVYRAYFTDGSQGVVRVQVP